MGNDDVLGLGDTLLDVRRVVEYGSLRIDSGRSIPEQDPMPQTYEGIREGEMGEGWTMRSAVQLDHHHVLLAPASSAAVLVHRRHQLFGP